MNKQSQFTAFMLAGILATTVASTGWAQQNPTAGNTSKEADRVDVSTRLHQNGNKQQKAWQTDDLMGWADSEDFVSSIGMTRMERKALFPFWDQADIARRVNINDEQKKDLTESYTKTIKAVEKAKSEARIAAIDLQAEMQKAEPSVSDVGDCSDKISEALKQKRRAIVSHAALVKSTLNEQQESDLRTVGREWSEKLSSDMSELRRNIESSMRGGGGADDIDAIFEGSSVPVQFRDRMYDDSTRRMERGQNWNQSDDHSTRFDGQGSRGNDAGRTSNRNDKPDRGGAVRNANTTPTPQPK